MQRTTTTTPDGNIRHAYKAGKGETTIVHTGLATGTLAVSDGTSYDVTPHYIAVAAKHAKELAHHIGVQHEDVGRFDSIDPATGKPIRWSHIDQCDHCADNKDGA